MEQNTTNTQFFHVTLMSKFPNVKYRDPVKDFTIDIDNPLHIVTIGIEINKVIDVIETKFNLPIDTDSKSIAPLLVSKIEKLEDGSECEAKYIIASKQDGNCEIFTITKSKEA